MSKYAGTKTEANLRAAFAGESQARNQYTFFASVAKKEGYEQMAALFLKTAENEKEHAKLWLKELSGIGDTKANLAAAAAGENYEWTDMYARFAAVAVQIIHRTERHCVILGENVADFVQMILHLLQYFAAARAHAVAAQAVGYGQPVFLQSLAAAACNLSCV